MRRRILESGNVGGVNPSQSKACGICFYDRTSDSLVIADGDTWNEEAYPSSRYVPIGVVVVPGYHDVYGDGSCGVMSLKHMNCDTPSIGGISNQGMYWGEYGTDISALPNLDKVPIGGNTSDGTPIYESGYCYLPSDRFVGAQCLHDTDAFYSRDNSVDFGPSPYLTDGSRNPGYYQTSSPSSSSNALADFDGIGNTEKIIIQRGIKDYNSWTPRELNEADYPAASCCDMFHTEGTSQGDWYLPACGELGYIMPPFNKINDTIDKVRIAYGPSVGFYLDANNYYRSSTECDDIAAYFVDTYYGEIKKGYKNDYYCVRAFLRVK